MYLYQDRIIPGEELHISAEDRGYYFGDGIYEVIRVYGGRCFQKAAHLQRLARSAVETRIALPCPIGEIGERLERLLAVEQIADGTIYVQITRGAAPRAHAFPSGAAPILHAYCTVTPRPLEAILHGIRALTVPDIRWLRCDIKTLNLLPNVLAKQQALDRGADDCIFHRDGIVTECVSSNLMIVREGEIWTHPADCFILGGVTRSAVLELAEAIGLPLQERIFSLEELRSADEVFLTSTIMEVTPIVTIDGRPVGNGVPGPRTRLLQAAFEQLFV